VIESRTAYSLPPPVARPTHPFPSRPHM
jgi:hypothetical protein